MSDEEQPGAQEERAKGKRKRASEPADAPQRAAEAYTQLANDLADAFSADDPSGRAQEAYERFLRTLREEAASERVAERYAASSRSYLRLLRTFMDPEGDNAEGVQTYMQDLAETWNPEEERSIAQEAYAAYVSAVGDALDPGELERRTDEAWQRYLAVQRELWSGLDEAPEVVAALAYGAGAAAALAGSAQSVVGQRRVARDRVAAATLG